MANFCGKCGSPIDQTTGLCPKCSPQAIRAEIPVSVAPVYTQPAAIDYSNNAAEPEKAKQRKKLVRIVSIVLAVLILIGGGTLGVLWLLKDRGYPVAGKGYLISNKYGIFYQTGIGVVNIKEVEEGILTDGHATLSMTEKTVHTGNTVYAMPSNERIIYKAEIEGETEVDLEIWMDEDELYDALSEDFGEIPPETLWDWQYSKGYIYFVVSCRLDYLASNTDYSENSVYRIGRINIKDKSIEMIDSDIHATSYVVDGNWIYYSENGYSYDKGHRNYDINEAGIYKMKLDGSKKEKLLDVEASDEDWENFQDYAGYTNLSIYKNKLYFIDNSEPRDNRLCRMKTNGKNVEEVSSECAYEYTIDTKRNKLYYITGPVIADNLITSQDFVEVNLRSLEENTIATFGKGGTQFFDIICHDSVLYFHSFDKALFSRHRPKGDDSDRLVGLYYDLKNQEATGIYAKDVYGPDEITQLPGGRVQIQTGKIIDIRLYTDKYENNDKFIEFKN